MLARLLDHAGRGVRLTVLLAVALVAGFAVASAMGAPGPTRLVTVAGNDSTASASAQPEKKGKPEKTGKPERAGQPDGGVHGACVAKVARDKTAVGGPHHNHGWAVSRAAHSCPHPSPTATDD